MDANAIRKKHLLRTILLSSYVVKNLFQIEMPFRVTFVRTIETNQNENMFHRLSIKKGGIFLGNYLTN